MSPLSFADAVEKLSHVGINNREIYPANAERPCLSILNTCLDIAACSVTKYPYGLTERFTQEEKEYYHRITAIFMGRGNSIPST